MIRVTVSGSTRQTEDFFKRMTARAYLRGLEKYGPMGVAALAAATPVDSAKTAESWYYEIVDRPGYFAIHWLNSNIEDPGQIPIATIIQYGHATGNGGYVHGRDYINPAMRPYRRDRCRHVEGGDQVMARSIDERVVSMAFENAKFEAGVAQSMATLARFNAALAKTGTESGLHKIEADASRVTLAGPMSAVDKLRAKLGTVGSGKNLIDIEAQADKVRLATPLAAVDKLKSKLNTVNVGNNLAQIQDASDKVTLSGISSAVEHVGLQVRCA